MNLTHSQKKYLKKNLNKLPLEKIASNLSLSNNDILLFARKNWSREKYQKIVKQNQESSKTKESFKPKDYFGFKNFVLKNWKALLFLTILTLGVYANNLKGAFLSDDIFGILENKNIGNFGYFLNNQPTMFLRPLFNFIIYKISGFNVIPFHLLNNFFHLGSVWLVFIIISFLANPLLAFFTAGIFAVHPLLTEGITWISGGPYTQYGFFLLLAFWLYLLARDHHRSLRLYFFSLLSFLLAMLTTEKAVVFPIMLLLFEFAFNQLRKNWKKLISYFILAFVWGILFIAQGAIIGRISSLENQYYQSGGIENPLVQIPIAISSYLQLFFWPDKLTLYHSELTFSRNEYFLRIIITLIYLGIILWSYLKKKRFLFFSLAFFIIVLLPTLTPLKLGWVVAERYIYLASLGLILPVAWLFVKIKEKTNKKIALIIFLILIAALSARTVIRNIDWKNQDNLWLAGAKTSPSSHQNRNNLGDLYARRGEYEKAVEEFNKAIELKPNYGDAYHNVGNVYHQMGKDDLAEESYKKALSFNPRLWQAYQNLAAIYFNQKKMDLALENMEKAVAINTESEDLYLNLGVLYINTGKNEKAKEVIQKALILNPQSEKAKQLLSQIKE